MILMDCVPNNSQSSPPQTLQGFWNRDGLAWNHGPISWLLRFDFFQVVPRCSWHCCKDVKDVSGVFLLYLASRLLNLRDACCGLAV
jgi:hypothetical protein